MSAADAEVAGLRRYARFEWPDSAPDLHLTELRGITITQYRALWRHFDALTATLAERTAERDDARRITGTADRLVYESRHDSDVWRKAFKVLERTLAERDREIAQLKYDMAHPPQFSGGR